MKFKKVLVTGHAGFIGSHLTKKLLKEGYQVIGVDNYNNYYNPEWKKENVKEFLTNKNFNEQKLDIVDYQKLKIIFEENEFDLVVHLAARAGIRPSLINPLLYEEVNVKGTLNLLELARKHQVKQFIFGSSSSVYGNQEKVPFAEDDPANQPVSPYAATKKSGEMLCYTYSYLHDIKMTVLRFFTVYGPKGRPDMAPYLFTEKILTGKTITRFGDGSTSRDYTYIDDAVAGIMTAIDKPFKFEIFNLGNNRPVSLNDFIALIEKITGKKAKIMEQPRHPADVKQTYAEIQKAKKLLNWQPTTPLEEGLKKFVEWYKANRLKLN
jgi:UDP-glucuronate 4-epimerase